MTMETIAINYIEFNVKNIAKSKAFYSALGWKFVDYGEQYCEFNSGALKGGFFQADDVNSKGGALVILFSHDLENTLNNIKNAGGIITADIFEFPGGKRFHFKDSDGYELAVWSNV
ncbi:VOC family protein [Wohlfahrtiimonas larvae]|uniref:VOC family protein n=1 Tax=Wohlfahrtiimonas larvae TaxID=1157986 RepID=A0ABP9MN50_9GAMM|nr:VOC family protein [Wohlfahrtiimonas larvae]